jgi:hypothetical protein
VKATMTKSIFFGAVLLAATCLNAGDKDKSSTDKMAPQVVDSGSFGIYVDGKRIGTETFKIEQRADYSIATAEIKVDDGKIKFVQTAEMQVNPNGDLRSYTWRATVPQKEEVTVVPQDQLLMEHIIPVDQKKTDVKHVLPASTVILDDYFFSHRQILLWRYLATGCVTKDNQFTCGPTQFNVFIPHVHTSVTAVMEVVGRDKIKIKGVEQEFNKLSLKTGDSRGLVMNDQKESDTQQWLLWVDDHYKIVKMSMPGTNVEIVRD